MFMPSREQMLQQLCPPSMDGSYWLKPDNNNSAEIAPNCPRCASSNTKFCYYNNYSFSQPRYFCKGCRRYWTKGGSLRNVPVGDGCRKNRRSCSSAKPLYQKNISSGSSSYNSPFDDTNNSGPDRIDLTEVFSMFLNPESSNKQADSYCDSMDVKSGQENIVVEESHTFEDLSSAFECERNKVEEEGAKEFSIVITSSFGWPSEDQLVVQEEGGLSLWYDDVGPVSPWSSSPMWQPMVHLQDLETMHIDNDQWAINNCFDTPVIYLLSRPAQGPFQTHPRPLNFRSGPHMG